jgi:hypothetical protein
VVFGKELVLLMEALENDSLCCFDALRDRVIQAVLSPPASSIQIIRTWLLEIFVRNIISTSPAALKELEALPAVIDKKQLLLVRGRCKDVNYFRRQKTAVQSFSDVERSCLVWGASWSAARRVRGVAPEDRWSTHEQAARRFIPEMGSQK